MRKGRNGEWKMGKKNNGENSGPLTSFLLVKPGALANRLQRRTARKANEANLDPPNPKGKGV